MIVTNTAMPTSMYVYATTSTLLALITALIIRDGFAISSPFLAKATSDRSLPAIPAAVPRRTTSVFQPFSTPNQDVMALLMLLRCC